MNIALILKLLKASVEDIDQVMSLYKGYKLQDSTKTLKVKQKRFKDYKEGDDKPSASLPRLYR